MKLLARLLTVTSLCAAAAVATPAIAAPLLSVVDQPAQVATATSLMFTAGSPSTLLTFAGYNVPSFDTLTNLNLVATGGTTNLLGTAFTFTPAASGSLANLINGGTGISFGGVTAGSYDAFSQAISTSVGTNYTLSFDLTVGGGQGNGLTITASDARTGAVPEPATWAMMLVGFGAAGYSLRRRRVSASNVQIA